MKKIDTPYSEQPHITLIGLRNSGKSSLINNIFNKSIAIVSDRPGTTTDPVSKSYELGKAGPVIFSDTAGIDDKEQEIGEKRVIKTKLKINSSDIILFVSPGHKEWTEIEIEYINFILKKKKKIIFAFTFFDRGFNNKKLELLRKIFKNEQVVYQMIDNKNKKGIKELKEKLIKIYEKIEKEITPVEGLVNENDLVLLVTPIDLAAPKGRLILPQVETIRDLLDRDCAALIVKERELKYFYENLKIKPALVITDSQAFSKVAADIPENQLLTSFSILFARKKGDLAFFIEGLKRLEETPAGAKILILEACNHHRQADDIGTVLIPRLFKQIVRSDVQFDFSRILPDQEKLKEYFLVIQCGGCMITRNFMLNRIEILKRNNIYGTNYGLFLAWANGLLPRALEPFEAEYELYCEIALK